MKALRKKLRERLAAHSTTAFDELAQLLKAEDERVRIVAIKEWREVMFGAVTQGGIYPEEDDAGGGLDLTHLNADERADAMQAVGTLRRLAALARDRAAGIIEQAE